MGAIIWTGTKWVLRFGGEFAAFTVLADYLDRQKVTDAFNAGVLRSQIEYIAEREVAAEAAAAAPPPPRLTPGDVIRRLASQSDQDLDHAADKASRAAGTYTPRRANPSFGSAATPLAPSLPTNHGVAW